MSARPLLAVACGAPPLVGLALGLWLAQAAVARAERSLLRAETAAAARLLREPGGEEAVERLLAGRVHVAAAIDPLLDEAVVEEDARGPLGRAAVYDAESWFVTGTLELRPEPALREPLPASLLGVSALAGLGIATLASAFAFGRLGPRRALVAAGGLLGVSLLAAGSWAEGALAGLSERRMALAVRALEQAPDRERLLGAPGGVFELTGLPFLLRDAEGGVAFSSLAPAATAALARVAAPAAPRVRLDGLWHRVADVGPVRLTLLPYEHSHAPRSALAALGLISLLVAALAGSLRALLGEPRALRRELVAWRFLTPAMLHLGVFTVGPLGFAAWLSLHRYSLIDPARPFVGVANYAALLRNGGFWNAVGNTALFTLHVPVSMALALGMALLVRRAAPGVLLARAALFLPSVTSLAAVAMVWQWMLNDEYGIVNGALALVGLPAVRWLTSPATALLSLMIVACWISVGYQMVLFQAGLSAIPQELYDAARIDGAGAWRRFRHVTLPGLRHTLFFVLVTSVIGSFQVFGTVYVMTEGGPLHATDVAVYHIYEEAWEYFRFGSASAMSFTLFAVVFGFTWLQFRTLERRLEGE